VTEEVFDPIEIIGVDEDQVGVPRNDGTPGSALYRVPIKLSRRPPAEWAEAFPEAWNHPPRFSTMHRRGIASITGATIVLDGTTIEEVRDVHARTLALVVSQLNDAQREHNARVQAETAKAAQQRTTHEANIRDVANQIKFD